MIDQKDNNSNKLGDNDAEQVESNTRDILDFAMASLENFNFQRLSDQEEETKRVIGLDHQKELEQLKDPVENELDISLFYKRRTTNISNDLITYSETDDEYVHSDTENSVDSRTILRDFELSGNNVSGLLDHASYFSNSLLSALDSSDLDKTLVVGAQLSGKLNNENQKLLEQRKILNESFTRLHQLFKQNFETLGSDKLSRVERLNKNIKSIEARIEKLRNGTKSLLLSIPFKKNKHRLGLAQMYPIEFHQAKDKVLERPIDED